MIRLIRQTMGENHPTGERIVKYIRDGHTNLARNALRESITGQRALIEMDEDEPDSQWSADEHPETREGDREDLDKYEMLLTALGN
jgi:hypothetical protein